MVEVAQMGPAKVFAKVLCSAILGYCGIIYLMMWKYQFDPAEYTI